MNEISLICTDCNGHLIVKSDSLVCSGCKNKFEIIEEIPQFLDKENYWSEPGITKETMIEIIDQMRDNNWHDILSKHKNEDIRNHYFFISNLARADWHNILNLNENAVILDLGGGMGTISHALSKHYRHIYSVEPVQLRCEFMKHRFKTERISNITIVRGDSKHLPFPDNFFNHIILNGVLEWIPYSYKDMNPRKAQILALRRLNRLLKKGGSISIGIENRFNYAFFLGQPDCHIGLRYVTILPRLLSHIICKLTIRDIYRPYLYSWRGLKNILSEAGFSNIVVYSSLPSYNEPLHTVPLDSKSDKYDEHIWKTNNKISLKLKHFMSEMDILKYFGYAFRVIAEN
jgi:ubiquinone/menaquinone biosynthesis C-methylase UbiE/uncharacterized protein YbaR (Trm112 family)